MKRFKQYVEEAKQEPSVRLEAERRLKIEREAMGMSPDPDVTNVNSPEFDIMANRRLQLANQVRDERSEKYPEEAEQRDKDLSIQKNYPAIAGALSISPDPVSKAIAGYLSSEVGAANERLNVNPTYRIANDPKGIQRKYPEFAPDNPYGPGVRYFKEPPKGE